MLSGTSVAVGACVGACVALGAVLASADVLTITTHFAFLDLLVWLVTVMVALPAFFPVTLPSLFTATTFELLLE